jgi:hypothetical protein
MVCDFHHLAMIKLRRRYTTKHGEVSRRLLLSLKQYINQCKNHLSSTNKWFFETAH